MNYNDNNNPQQRPQLKDDFLRDAEQKYMRYKAFQSKFIDKSMYGLLFAVPIGLAIGFKENDFRKGGFIAVLGTMTFGLIGAAFSSAKTQSIPGIDYNWKEYNDELFWKRKYEDNFRNK